MAKTTTKKAASSGHMDLWDRVTKTDPADTKEVNVRGGFTAIDAYAQIRNATKEFGPVGQGWGWDVVDIHFPPNNTIAVHISMWVGDIKDRFSVFGQKNLGANKPDEDAFKKALTDAVTKGLSYLGFNTDVFLGKFEDSKYVEERKAEVTAQKARNDTERAKEWADMAVETVTACADEAAFVSCQKTLSPAYKAFKVNHADQTKRVEEAMASKRNEFTPAADAAE